MAVVTAMGLFLSTLVRTTAQLQTMAPIVIVATCMLGGCYWSLEMVSPTMQAVSKFTPQAWAMAVLNDVVLRGRSLSSTAPNLLVLACFGLVWLLSPDADPQGSFEDQYEDSVFGSESEELGVDSYR